MLTLGARRKEATVQCTTKCPDFRHNQLLLCSCHRSFLLHCNEATIACRCHTDEEELIGSNPERKWKWPFATNGKYIEQCCTSCPSTPQSAINPIQSQCYLVVSMSSRSPREGRELLRSGDGDGTGELSRPRLEELPWPSERRSLLTFEVMDWLSDEAERSRRLRLAL